MTDNFKEMYDINLAKYNILNSAVKISLKNKYSKVLLINKC